MSVIPQGLLRPVQSTAPSGPWLFPAPDLWGNQVPPVTCQAPCPLISEASLRQACLTFD